MDYICEIEVHKCDSSLTVCIDRMTDFICDENILEMRLIHEIPKNEMSQNERRFQSHEMSSACYADNFV